MKVYYILTHIYTCFGIFPHLRNGDFTLQTDTMQKPCRWQLGREAHREAIATREVEVTARVRRVGTTAGEVFRTWDVGKICENHGEHIHGLHGL